MVVERTDTEIIVRIPSYVGIENVQQCLDLIKWNEATARSQATQEDIDKSEFAGLIERQIARQALQHSVTLATQHGISSMTMDEINAEVNAVRQCKK